MTTRCGWRVFDRAAPTYDRIGEAYHAYFAARLLDLAVLPRDAHLLDACFREMDALQAPGGYPLRLSALIVTGRR